MFGIHDYWAFVAAGVLLNLTPGQDSLYIVGRSLAGGRGAGVASALGVGTGALVHVTAATFGLSALLSTSAAAFAAVKWAGVAYLLYLGIRSFRGRDTLIAVPAAGAPSPSLRAAYFRGALTNILNPKVAVFFLAFLPQFVDPVAPTRELAFLALGGTFVCTGTGWCLILAVAASRAARTLRRSPAMGTVLGRVSGGMLVALGVKLALERSR